MKAGTPPKLRSCLLKMKALGRHYSLVDAEKLDAVRLALRQGDLKAAAKLARVYELKPVAAE